MKLNISYPVTGQQKLIEINDDVKLHPFMDKHMGEEVEGSSLGDEYKGYVFKISGGNDKQGFPMKQGILTSARVRVLLKAGEKCYRPRRKGERKRKSVRGCITSNDLCVLDLVVVKKGPKELAGITDSPRPRRLGPKRAGKIRKLFSLPKGADVRQFVVRRKVKGDRTKAPKIQRLVTPVRVARKKYLERQKIKKAVETRNKLTEYREMVAAERKKERKELRERAKARKAKRLAKKERKAKAQEAKRQKMEQKAVEKKEEKKPTKKNAPVKEGKKQEAVKKVSTPAAVKASFKVNKKTVNVPTKKEVKQTPKEVKKDTKTKKQDMKKQTKAPAKKVEKKPEAKKPEPKKTTKPQTKQPAKSAPAPAKGKKPQAKGGKKN